MKFDWNEAKRQATMKKRDVDFVRAARIFENEVTTRRDLRQDYGEDRLISVGMIDDECFVVVWTPRSPKNRIISAWKGGRDERRRYQERFPRRDPGDGSEG